jgi:hypothetical protein
VATATLSLEGLALTVGRALASLEQSLSPPNATAYFRTLGIGFSDLEANGVVSDALEDASEAVGALAEAAENLGLLVDAGSENTAEIIIRGGFVVDAIINVTTGFDNLKTAFLAEKANLGVDASLVEELAGELPLRLFSVGLIEFAETKVPGLALLFSSFGIFERVDVPGVLDDPTRPSFTFRRLNLGGIVDAISDPVGLLTSLYGFGGASFGNPAALPAVNGVKMLLRLAEALKAGGFPAVALFDIDPNFPSLTSDILRVGINPAILGLRLEFTFPVPSPLNITVPLTDRWSATGTVSGDGLSGVAIDITPPDRLSVTPGGGASFNARLSIGVAGTPPSGEKFVLIGVAGGSRLEVDSIGLSLGFDLVFDTGAGSAKATPFVSTDLTGGRVILDLSAGDGFLKSLLGGPIQAPFDLGVSFSLERGIRFEGGAFELNLPLHLEFAGVKINGLKLGLPLGQGSGLPIHFSTSLAATFGPFSMVLDQIGLETEFDFEGSDLGIGGFNFGFKRPTGIGVSINGGAISGGGFLSHDPVTGRYAGAIELRVFMVAVKAFGILDTRFPDGTEGMSFVVVISAEFTPIQLGFGFTLVGVGGILGINRSIAAEALSNAVRTGALAHLLFPQNVVQNAPAIINDLATVFPATRDRQLFGPMAKFGWGTPTLITADIGIVIEFPGPRLALLGVVRMVLPSAKLPLMAINCAIAGFLDFPAGKMSIDASLFDSRVAGYVVSGDMAYRLETGNSTSFLLSVGGFNPGFDAPARFPDLRRASVDLGVSGNPRLTASGYFALTSNTAQFGGRIDLNFREGGFRVDGHFGFDTLFVFSPFRFTANISAGIHVSYEGVGFGVTLHGELKGPTPWQFNGRVCVDLLLDEVCLGMSFTFGRSEPAALPEMDPWFGNTDINADPRVQVIGLQAAITDARNWQGEEPENGFRVVSLSQAATASRTPIDPVGPATLRQKVCPLDQELEKFGEYRPVGHTRFDISSVGLAGQNVGDFERVDEAFAPAHFTELSKSQKLSSRSYDDLVAGVKIAPNRAAAGPVGGHTVAFETVFITADGQRIEEASTDPRFTPTDLELRGMLKRSSAALSGVRRAGAQKYMLQGKPKLLTFGKPKFVVAGSCDLTWNTSITQEQTSYTKALLALREHERNHPEDRNRFRVVAFHAAA